MNFHKKPFVAFFCDALFAALARMTANGSSTAFIDVTSPFVDKIPLFVDFIFFTVCPNIFLLLK
jgi:hypothetical protein